MSTPCRLPIANLPSSHGRIPPQSQSRLPRERPYGLSSGLRFGLLLALLLAVTTSPVWALGERGWIPNHGQFDDAVEYMARGNGVDVYLTEDALVLDVWDESTALRLPLSVEVAGGTAEPQGVSTTHLNYFLGDDPSKWAANVPVYTDVVLRDDRRRRIGSFGRDGSGFGHGRQA